MNTINVKEARKALTDTEYAILLQLNDKVQRHELTSKENEKQEKQKMISDFFKNHLKNLGYEVFDLNENSNHNFIKNLLNNVQHNLPIFENEPVIEDKDSVDYLINVMKKKGYSENEINHIIFSAMNMNVSVNDYLKSYL